MTSVQAINPSQTFTANTNKSQKQYTGTIIGGGAAAAIGVLACTFPGNKGTRILSALKTFAKNLPLFAGSGFLVDYLNNRQRGNAKPNAKTDKGNDYTKVNSGKKYGAILGVVAPLVMRILSKNAVKTPFAVKLLTLPAQIMGMAITALGGYGLGALTDRLQNSKTAKEIDNVA